MERIYSKLYQCTVEHTFYTDGVSADLNFMPIGKTSKFLRAHALTFFENQNGFELLHRTDSGGLNPFTEITESNKLFIGLGVDNVELFNFTNFPSKTASSDIYLLSDIYSTGVLNPTTIARRQPSFTEEYSYNNSTATLRVEDAAGNAVFKTTLHGLQDEVDLTLYHYSFSVDLGSSLDIGQYKLKTFLNGVLEDELDVFIYNQFEWPGLIGIFELELDENIVYDTSLPYEAAVSLQASSSVWTYQVEMSRNYTNGILNIVNTDGTFTFNETTAPTDYLSGEIAIFESSIAVTKTEASSKAMNLVITSDDQDLTITGLPNPSPYIANSTVYLKI
ncbi:MAG: hypothetical protein P8P74_06540 [Crocinitomicaceae bacterium]|nr:hypothetical protein [Crocinitomicaceae bacterium]